MRYRDTVHACKDVYIGLRHELHFRLILLTNQAQFAIR